MVSHRRGVDSNKPLGQRAFSPAIFGIIGCGQWFPLAVCPLISSWQLQQRASRLNWETSVSFSSQQSSGSGMAPLPFLYQHIAPINPAIVATKPFVYLNDFLHNRLLSSYKLPDSSYLDILDLMFLLILPRSFEGIFVAPARSYDELKTLDLLHSLQKVFHLISIFPYSPGTLAGPHRECSAASWVPLRC